MIITIKLANVFITLQSYLFFLFVSIVKTLKIYPFGKLLYATVLLSIMPGCTVDLQNQFISHN